MHARHLSSSVTNEEQQPHSFSSKLVERHINSETSNKHLHYSNSNNNNNSTMGSTSLCDCLDLLVKVQKTQGESVTILTSLREKLFPTDNTPQTTNLSTISTNSSLISSRSVVTFDEVDREVLRLRILEVKLSGLHPKLSESIENVLLPFQSFIRQEIENSNNNNNNNNNNNEIIKMNELFWESYRRVACLREQFIGLAQLQEEAMQSLGVQLSELFPKSSTGTTLYYYYPSTTYIFHENDVSNFLKYNYYQEEEQKEKQRQHSSLLQFLQQLEDVMRSKQSIIVSLAMSLREIYNPTVGKSSSTNSSLTGVPHSSYSNSTPCILTTSDNNNNNNNNNNNEIARCVSVSVSPMSTIRPSCSTPREVSLRTLEKDRKEIENNATPLKCFLSNEKLREFHRSRSASYISDNSPSPNAKEYENILNTVKSSVYNNEKENKEKEKSHELLYSNNSVESDISPESGNPRSPSFLLNSVNKNFSITTEDFTPPPPLAKHFEKESEVSMIKKNKNVEVQLNKEFKLNNSEEENKIECEVASSNFTPSSSVDNESYEEIDNKKEGENNNNNNEYQKNNGANNSNINLLAENIRLSKMIESKDNLILTMQERVFSVAVPLLNERAEERSYHSSKSNSRSCSCHSHHSLYSSSYNSNNNNNNNNNNKSDDEIKLADNFSTCKQKEEKRKEKEEKITREYHELLQMESTKWQNDMENMKNKLTLQSEDNNRLRNTLNITKDEKQRWKQIARELKEDNKNWRDKERKTRLRCEQLEDDIIALKKRLLTAEGALMLHNTISPPKNNNEEITILHTSSNHGNNNNNNNITNHLNQSNKSSKRSLSNNNNSIITNDIYDESSIIPLRQEVNSSPMRSRSRSRTQPPLISRDEAISINSISSLQQKRKEIFNKLSKRTENEAQLLTSNFNPKPEYEEEPVVVVSPLTEERVINNNNNRALTNSPLPNLISSNSFVVNNSPQIINRIDRRLSPEYKSPNLEENFSSVNTNSNNNEKSDKKVNSQLSTIDVNRILANARILLKSVKPKTTSTKTTSQESYHIPSYSSEDSSDSDYSLYSFSDNEIKHSPIIQREKVKIIPVRRSASPPLGAISPCSSVSYSSAKKRTQQNLNPSEQNNNNNNVIMKNTSLSKNAPTEVSPSLSLKLNNNNNNNNNNNKRKLMASPKSNGKSKLIIVSPKSKELTQNRQSTAREGLMRELREQLHLLQTQHARVLQQEEELDLKRKQVSEAIQRCDNNRKGSDSESDSISEDPCYHLISLLKKFDKTQEKVRRNEVRLREHVEIVRQQLKTLEEDLI